MTGDTDFSVSDFGLSDIYQWITTVTLQAQNIGHDIKYSRETWPSFFGGLGGVGFSVSCEHTQNYSDRSVDTEETKAKESGL